MPSGTGGSRQLAEEVLDGAHVARSVLVDGAGTIVTLTPGCGAAQPARPLPPDAFERIWRAAQVPAAVRRGVGWLSDEDARVALSLPRGGRRAYG